MKDTHTHKEKYVAQVLSVEDNKCYNLFFLDGTTKLKVPEKVITPLRKRDREDKLLGKAFFDGGGKKFKRGEFVVLARALMKSPGSREVSYWCERQTEGVHMKWDIVLFGRHYTRSMIKKYGKE